MITLYSKDFATKYGYINSLCEAFVEEERNGLFELSFIMLNTDSLFNYVKEENIVVVNANDTLLNQKFRIYMTRKLMNNRVEVFARHISFDLMYDYIDSISFENQSCEYALNQLFRNSNFSKHYRGYSDIVNAQNYSMSMANVLEAIGGKQGSIIDTFGTGAEILRDNENIYVLNKRGYDNEVTIEYKKNLTGFELEEDTTDLVTRILPYAKYNNSETNEEIIVKADYVDSPLIANYSHPYIASIDYSDKFENDEIPTISKLQELARKEYRDNKVDIPKQNFKIEFIPLSKCVGYDSLEDKISLCDTVTIVDTRYNIKTQSKVIKTVFNVLKNRYESMELGDPKTSLGDIVGNGDSLKGEKGDKGDKGDKGEDGNIGDFPNSLPSTPIVTATVYGFANIEISWTFENKVYYQYEVYASKEADFVPNTFNLIHQGQTSTFMYQAKPNETWYFKVCAINTHGNRTSFGSAYATTSKVDDLSNYVSSMAIDDALIGTLRLDRGWVGTLRGNYIDAKQLSVTDGNGKRTLDIDSFGNVNLDLISLKINNTDIGSIYANKTELNQLSNEFELKAVSIQNNLLNNSNGFDGLNWWGISDSRLTVNTCNDIDLIKKGFYFVNSSIYGIRFSQDVALEGGVDYCIQLNCTEIQGNVLDGTMVTIQDSNDNFIFVSNKIKTSGIYRFNFKLNESKYYKFGIWHNGASQTYGSVIKIEDILLVKGKYENNLTWVDNANDMASISIKANQIVNKVSASDVSSIIEQNPKSVEVAFNNISNNVQNTEGKFIIRNGAIELYNNEGHQCFSMDTEGWLKVWGLKVYGPQNPIQFTGTGDKGIEINSDQDCMSYIDFSKNGTDEDYVARIAQIPGTSMITMIGGLEVVPDIRKASDAKIELRSPTQGPCYIDFSHNDGEDYQKRIVSFNNDPCLRIYGGLMVDDVPIATSKNVEQLKAENELLKSQLLEQEEILIENAFLIAKLELGGL